MVMGVSVPTHPFHRTNPIYCPDPGATEPNDNITNNPQGGHPQPAAVGVDSRQASISAQHRRPA
jgi:hypothetical protein